MFIPTGAVGASAWIKPLFPKLNSVLDTSGASASQAGWKVIRKLPLPDNNYGSAAGSQVQMEVSLNESFFGQFTAGI